MLKQKFADPPTRRAIVIFTIVTVLVGVGDQLTKLWALKGLTVGVYYPIFGSFFGLNLIRNPGAAFSLLSNHTWIFTLLTVFILIVVGTVLRRVDNAMWLIALGLLAGGGVGNLIDRLFRTPYWGQGHVVDFLAYSNWFVGNVADIAIVIAGILVVILIIFEVPFSATKAQKSITPRL